MTKSNESVTAHENLKTATVERDLPTKTKQEWNAPLVSRLTIAETEFGGGSPTDGEGTGSL